MKDAQAVALVRQQLLGSLLECDRNGNNDGRISQPELMNAMCHDHTKAVLSKLNINYLSLIQLQKVMFPTPESTVPVKAVLDLMVMCRGNCGASVQTLAGGFCFVEHQ